MPLEEQITAQIQEKSSAFCERARICFHRRLKDIGSNVQENGENLGNMIRSLYYLLEANAQKAECELISSCAEAAFLTYGRVQ